MISDMDNKVILYMCLYGLALVGSGPAAMSHLDKAQYETIPQKSSNSLIQNQTHSSTHMRHKVHKDSDGHGVDPQQATLKAGPNAVSNYPPNLQLLTDRYERKMHDLERRLMRKLRIATHDDASSTDSINTINNDMRNIRLQLEASLATQRHQGELLTSFQQHMRHQKHEMHRIKEAEEKGLTEIKKLEKTVEQLRNKLDELKQHDVNNNVTSPDSPDKKTPYPPGLDLPFTPIFPKDCYDVYAADEALHPGFYYIMVQPLQVKKPFNVACKMTNTSGWTVIQHRRDGAVDFYRTWSEYRDGFGDLEGEFWLGNKHINQLTNQGDYKLRIELIDWDQEETYWAEYDHFRIDNEDGLFRIHVHGYHGTAGDALTSEWESHDNQAFSTYDRDNDKRYYDNCAEHYHGAWWFKSCFESHLNGVFYEKGGHNNYFVRDGIQWNPIHTHSSLQSTMMMIKPNPGQHPDKQEEADNRIDSNQ